jgi:UDP-N-acetylmuramoylalanine--D-glutamate ligase
MDLKGLKSKPACNAMRSISGRNICILGWGIENQALVRFLLKKKIDCQITICDARNKKELEKTTSFVILTSALSRWKNLSNRSEQDSSSTTQNDRNGIIINFNLGKNYNKNLDKYDIIFRSPGYPLFEKNIIKAKQAGVIVSSPMKLFFEICPTKNIIGVTGTKGKGTTASLIYKILKTTGKRVWLGGNIGIAPFGFIDKIKKNDWVVLELSSFQLEDMDVSPKIAVVTNFYKEHLAPADPNNPNYHKSVKAYWDAKANIFKWQKKNDYIVLNSKLKTQNSKVQIKSKKNIFW